MEFPSLGNRPWFRAGLPGRWIGWATISASMAIVLVGGLLLAASVSDPDDLADRLAAPDVGPVVATVERLVMKQEVTFPVQVSEDQVLVTASPSIADDGEVLVVTSAPVLRGTEVKAGDLLVTMSGRPVFVMQGSIPLYRDILPGATGPDVNVVQSALLALGYDVSQDGEFGPRTQEALAAFYRDRGFEPAIDGASADAADAIQLNRRAVEDAVMLLGEAKQADETALAEYESSLALARSQERAARQAAARPELSDEERATAEQAFAEATASLEAAVLSRPQLQVPTAQASLERAQQDLARTEIRYGPVVRRSELIVLTETTAKVAQSPFASGSVVQAGETVIALETGDIELEADVAASIGDSLREGMRGFVTDRTNGSSWEVQVQQSDERVPTTGGADDLGGTGQAADEGDGLPEGNSQEGSTVNQEVQSETSGSTRVRFAFIGVPPDSSRLGSELSVNVTIASTDGPVLAVPASAVSDGSGGGYTLEVVDDAPPNEGPDREGVAAVRIVPVRLGMAAEGLVEVTPIGADLDAGDSVVIDTPR